MSDSIVWKMLEQPGHEFASIAQKEGGWELSGTAVLLHEHFPSRIDYVVKCDSSWSTRSAHVLAIIEGETLVIDLEADADKGWRRNGITQPETIDCSDVDLGFSPSTNTLPIRRLALSVGQEAEVKAAWLRFPSFELKELTQVYRREGDKVYRYESGGGSFICTLEVNDAGFVTDYPGLWRAEPAT